MADEVRPYTKEGALERANEAEYTIGVAEYPEDMPAVSDSDIATLRRYADLVEREERLRRIANAHRDCDQRECTCATALLAILAGPKPIATPAPTVEGERCGGSGMIAYRSGTDVQGEMCPGCRDCDPAGGD